MCAEEPIEPRKEELRRILRNFVDPVSKAPWPLWITDDQEDEILNQAAVDRHGNAVR